VPEGIRPPPEPLDVDAVRVIVVGTALWFAAFLALLPFHDRLAADGHMLWLWTCVAGTGLGLVGLALCLWQQASQRGAKSAAPPTV
jgi:Protein of unknown function (DUF2530)